MGSHVKKETKSKSNIGDIKDQHGNIKTEDVYMAEILKDLFCLSINSRGLLRNARI